MGSELLIERHGRTLWLTIQHEDRRDVTSAAVLKALTTALVGVGHDAAVRAVMLTGADTHAFCTGTNPQTGQSFRFDCPRSYRTLADSPRQARRCAAPLITYVNGACIADGADLLVMCDLAVANHNATFGLPEVKVGVFPAQVLAMLQHQLPHYVLDELYLTDGPMNADRAFATGLVNGVTEPGALDGAVSTLLVRLIDRSPSAIRHGLYTLKYMGSLSFEQIMAFTEGQIGLLVLTENAQEDQAAFREKCAPSWRGR